MHDSVATIKRRKTASTLRADFHFKFPTSFSGQKWFDASWQIFSNNCTIATHWLWINITLIFRVKVSVTVKRIANPPNCATSRLSLDCGSPPLTCPRFFCRIPAFGRSRWWYNSIAKTRHNDTFLKKKLENREAGQRTQRIPKAIVRGCTYRAFHNRLPPLK